MNNWHSLNTSFPFKNVKTICLVSIKTISRNSYLKVCLDLSTLYCTKSKHMLYDFLSAFIKQTAVTILLFAFSITVKAQQRDKTTPQKNVDSINKSANSIKTEYYSDTIIPEFIGGRYSWIKFIEKNMNQEVGKFYPERLKGMRIIKQTAIISFIVQDDGTPTDFTVKNASELHPRIVEEALRIMKKNPKWNPAICNGKKVAQKMEMRLTWVYSND